MRWLKRRMEGLRRKRQRVELRGALLEWGHWERGFAKPDTAKLAAILEADQQLALELGEAVDEMESYLRGEGSAPAVSPILDTYVLIQASRNCADCDRFHDVGDVMHFSKAVVNGALRQGWFCVDCMKQIEHDPIPWAPPGCRWSDLHSEGEMFLPRGEP